MPENETKMIMERITALQKELREKQVAVAMEEATVNGVSFSGVTTLWACCLLRSDSKWSEGNCSYRHRFTCDPHVIQESCTDSSLEEGRIQLPAGMERDHDSTVFLTKLVVRPQLKQLLFTVTDLPDL